MDLKLTIYTDETFTEVKRVAEANELVIPYRVSIYILQSLDKVNLNSEDDIFKLITNSIDKLDKVIKATFRVTESELECVNGAELVAVGKELYTWCIGKMNGLQGGNLKNVIAAANK